jgi:hypothetical protein
VAAILRESRYDASRRLVRRNPVNVRWASGLSDEQRRALEERYGLRQGVERDVATWRYDLGDLSPANVRALLGDPNVVDTHGIDRQSGALSEIEAPEGASTEPELLVGTAPCDVAGDVDVLVEDQPDGQVVALVDAPEPGVAFFSEPYYPEREAFVDGQAAVALKANLAFTAVRVPAGRHRIEIRHVPRGFHLGLWTGVATLSAWAALVWWQGRRSR